MNILTKIKNQLAIHWTLIVTTFCKAKLFSTNNVI